MRKFVVVTGGTGSIGEAVVRYFAAHDYSVAFLYHAAQNKAEEMVSELQRLVSVRAYCCDLRDPESVKTCFARIFSEMGLPSVLVNCAGFSYVGLLQDMSDRAWKDILDINLTGAFYCIREVLPGMISEKEGSIVNISSMWGMTGASCEAAYSASKAGLIGLTKALAKEVGPSGIRVNAVAPGLIESPMNAHLSKEEIDGFCEETPIGRQGTPMEVAEAVYYMANATFVTGEVLNITGGYVI